MCGRYSLAKTKSQIALSYDISETDSPDLDLRYNIAPTQLAPIVLQSNGIPHLQLAHWGLIPSWSIEFKMKFATINARQEEILQKPLYKKSFLNRRCVVPIDGYYEWIQESKKKQPLYFHSDFSIVSLAGIYDLWEDSQQTITKFSFSILTTASENVPAQFHDRQPLFLNENSQKIWLDPSTEVGHLERVTKQKWQPPLQVIRANPLMNSVKFEGKSCLESQSTLWD